MKKFFLKHLTGIIIAALLLMSAGIYVYTFVSVPEDKIVVIVDGKQTGIYSLSSEQQVRIETAQGYNILSIKDGVACVTESDCRNQVCVHTKAIGKSAGQIVCIPHRVVIRSLNSKESEVDIVAN